MQAFLNYISIAAFLMSLTTWALAIFNNSIRVSVSVKDYAEKLHDIVQLFIHIQNNSNKSITISEISIVDGEHEHYCELVPKKITTRNGVDTLVTPMFPINLSPYQGVLHPFEFLRCEGIELGQGKTVVLRIYTNRKPLERSITLSEQLYYLRIKK